jgi:hypothetical protein
MMAQREGARTGSRPMSDNAILAVMRRLGIGKEEMTGHGFHAVRDPNGRVYNRTAHLDERRKMMQQWSDLDGLKD